MRWIWIFSVCLLFALPHSATAQSDTALLTITHDERVTFAGWNTSETQLLTTSEDGAIRLSDAQTGEQIWQTTHTASIDGASWSHDDSLIVAWGADNLLFLINAQTGEIIDTNQNDNPIHGGLWKRDDSAVMIYTDNFIAIPTIRGNSSFGAAIFGTPLSAPIISAQWSADETKILIFDESLTLYLWDTILGSDVRSFRLPEATTGIAWSADETRLASWGLDSDVRVWDLTENGLVASGQSFPHSRTFVIGAQWAMNDTVLLTWGADETARLWDIATSEEKIRVRHTDWVTGARLNADATKLITWAYQFGYVWDANTGELILQVSHDNLVSGAILNGDESRLLTWGWDGTARVWEINES
ncbi:MAG: WD40 repeat domain-containing protein [bacterium]|nr:WD40 repeat domain-containing protein [bacterium]